LYWKGGGKHLTIPLGDKDNVATMQLTPGYSRFHNFCDKAPTNNDQDPITMHPATTISNNEDDKDDRGDNQEENWDKVRLEMEKGAVARESASPKITTMDLTEPLKPTATDLI
jgi:hypothetical protein